jgi:hypothetical protein
MTEPAALVRIHTQILWNRLLAVVEEQAQTLVRTAFSTTVREAGDLSGTSGDRNARARQCDGGQCRLFPRKVSHRRPRAG